MNGKTQLFGHLLLLFISISLAAETHILHQGQTYNYQPSIGTPRFQIFCYEGKPKYIIHVWQSVILNVNHSSDVYNQYDGATPEAVQKHFLEKRNSWSLNLFSSKQKNIKLDPFNNSCIGIDSSHTYSVYLNVIKIDFWKVSLLISGILLFISADKLSKNTFFYYLCGISFGICASFLILIYFASKIIPRKPFMYGVLGCGWTVVLYFLQMLWENIQVVLISYRAYLAWYIGVSGVISFILCYRWGPIENQRTKNLIKWSLQLMGLVAVFFSSQFQEAAMGQIVVLVIGYNLPKKWIAAPKTYWKKRFPPKLKLLSTDEYYEQGVRETTKALEELREFCSSPKCNQWQMALKLKDVKRFASFIEGNSHLSDDEVLEYETSVQADFTDEEYTEEDEDEF